MAQEQPPPAAAPPAPSASPAATDDAPAANSASDIIERFLEVTGGREAWADVSSIRGMGALDIVGTTLTADVAIYQMPTAYRRSVDHDQSGAQVTIRNGDRAWQLRPDGVVDELHGPQLEALIRDKHLNPLLHADDIYSSMEVLGVEQVDTVQAWKIRCVPADAGTGEVLRYFDVATGFQVKIVEFGPAEEPGIPTEIYPADYREVGSVMVPFETTMALLRSRMRITMHAMQTNVDLPACLFEPPPAAAPATP
jgi:hypothetical protein